MELLRIDQMSSLTYRFYLLVQHIHDFSSLLIARLVWVRFSGLFRTIHYFFYVTLFLRFLLDRFQLLENVAPARQVLVRDGVALGRRLLLLFSLLLICSNKLHNILLLLREFAHSLLLLFLDLLLFRLI